MAASKDAKDDAVAPEEVASEPEKVSVFVPEGGPTADNPAVVRQEGLAKAGSTADVPPHDASVVIVPTGGDPEDAKQKAVDEAKADESGTAVDPEGSNADTVLTGDKAPENVES